MTKSGVPARRTWLGVTAIALAMIAVGWVAACFRYVAHPTVDPLQRVDAVHVLGPALDKMDVARVQMQGSGAQTMVITVPADESVLRQKLGCGDKGLPYEVICVSPDPMTTQGESMVLAQLVRERGWTTVAVVTYTSHVSRSRLQMERCVPADVVLWQKPDPDSMRWWAFRFVYETGAWAKAQVVRGC